MGNSIEYYFLDALKKHLAFITSVGMHGTLNSQTLYDYTSKAVPNEHNFLTIFQLPLLILVYTIKEIVLVSYCPVVILKLQNRDILHWS